MGTKKTPTSIGAVLFTKTQRRVLGLLYGQPDRSFYTKEVVRLAEVGIGTVQRELSKLAASELQLGRSANPSIYDPAELRNKLADGNAFLTRILAQPKIFLIGSEHDLRESRPSGSSR